MSEFSDYDTQPNRLSSAQIEQILRAMEKKGVSLQPDGPRDPFVARTVGILTTVAALSIVAVSAWVVNSINQLNTTTQLLTYTLNEINKRVDQLDKRVQ